MNKDDMLKMLREDKTMKHVLSLAKNDDERRKIKAYAESFALNFYKNIFAPVEKEIQKDPEVLKKALLEIKDGLINSGSSDAKS
jgi:GT2 family glycosyltransferase